MKLNAEQVVILMICFQGYGSMLNSDQKSIANRSIKSLVNFDVNAGSYFCTKKGLSVASQILGQTYYA